MTETSRSKPMPVSTCFEGRGLSEPSSSRLNWINTLFQISRTSGSSLLTRCAALRPPIRSKWISLKVVSRHPKQCLPCRLTYKVRMVQLLPSLLTELSQPAVFTYDLAFLPQKLSLAFPGSTWSSGTPCWIQNSFTSKSGSSEFFGSPSKYVTYSRSLGSLYTRVSKSQE